jgi:hypothetical protein
MPSLDEERTCISCFSGMNNNCTSSVNPTVGVVTVSCIKLPSSLTNFQSGCEANQRFNACHSPSLAASGFTVSPV